MEAPLLITDVGLELATSDSQVDQARGLRLLRVLGSEDRMLERCYDDAFPMLRLTGLLRTRSNQVPLEDAQTVYFRVTGTPFNAVKRLRRSSATGRGGGWDDASSWYWATAFGDGTPPWWMITIVERVVREGE